MSARAKTAAPRVDPARLVSQLVDIGNTDTVYRDVYLERARMFLGEVISPEDFGRIERQQADMASLPLTIARALQRENWAQVQELTARMQAIRRESDGKRSLVETARGVYAVGDVRLDPFSPGLQRFVRLPTKDLETLRTRALEQLAALEGVDPSAQNFYAGRRAAFQGLVLGTGTAAAGETAPAAAATVDPREAAAQALRAGDMRGLEELAKKLMATAKPGTERPGARGPAAGPAPAQPATDLLMSFSDDTLARARQLGLAPRRLESRTELAPLRSFAWNPMFSDDSGGIRVKEVPLPAGTPEGFRDRLEMLMIHPLVNSGGARHLPKLVAEDVLVEDFADPREGETTPVTGLLTILELPGRRALARLTIERALLAHGSRILDKELGLDPRVFRLVCIPPDVHLRLGEGEGWGRQPCWTHFDGYLVMADGRLQALAGADVRFGGLYDLLGLSRDYDSDHVIVRFAVVRRERMVAW